MWLLLFRLGLTSLGLRVRRIIGHNADLAMLAVNRDKLRAGTYPFDWSKAAEFPFEIRLSRLVAETSNKKRLVCIATNLRIF